MAFAPLDSASYSAGVEGQASTARTSASDVIWWCDARAVVRHTSRWSVQF